MLTENHILAFRTVAFLMTRRTRIWFSGCSAPLLLNYHALFPHFSSSSVTLLLHVSQIIFSNPSLDPDSYRKKTEIGKKTGAITINFCLLTHLFRTFSPMEGWRKSSEIILSVADRSSSGWWVKEQKSVPGPADGKQALWRFRLSIDCLRASSRWSKSVLILRWSARLMWSFV